MPVYLIIDIAVRNPEAKADYAEYICKARPIIESHGGRYLARGGKITLINGDWNPERVVMIEFPSLDHVNQWWNDPAYQAIKGLRENAVFANAIVVEGCGPQS